MTDEVSRIAGCLFVSLFCAWGVWSLGAELRSRITSGTAVNRMLSEVNDNEAPGLFTLQLVGLVLLMAAAALIGIGATVAMVAIVLRFVAG